MNKDNLDKIITLRHELHRHPELSLQETWTKQHLMEFLKEHTDHKIVDKGKWFYAVCRGIDRNRDPMAFRADFDAVAVQETCELPYVSEIPGVGHKCGHDGHSSVLCGLALELLEEKPLQDTYLIFQHGEEIGQGGEECSRLIPEKGIKQVYAFHNRSGYEKHTVVYSRDLAQCASRGLTITLTGTPAHASQPEDGINPAVTVADIIRFSQELVNCSCFTQMVLCTIIHAQVGEKNFGIAASKAEVSMTLRANVEAELDLFEQKLREYAEGLANERSLRIAFAISDPFPETRNDPAAVERVLAAARQCGYKTLEMKQPWRASEDFGYYTKQCSGAMIYVGNGMQYPEVHTAEYDFCDDIIPTCVDLFTALATSEC